MPFVSDSFTDTDSTTLQSHTGETGATWTKLNGSDSVISSNQLGPPTFESGYSASGSPNTAEYDVEAELYTDTTNGDASVLGRLTDYSNFYLAQHNSASGSWRLFKRLGGSYTLLGSYTESLVVDTTYSMTLEIRDAAKKLFINGVERISSADNALTSAGVAGIRFDGNAGRTGYRLDNFTATDLSPSDTSGAVTESTDAGDAVSVLASLIASTAESSVAADTVSGIASLLASFTESAEAGDVQAVIAAFQSAITEGAEAGETWASLVTKIASTTESTSANDAVSTLASLLAEVSEDAAAGDAWMAVVSGDLLALITEDAEASETVTSTASLLAAFVEGSEASETFAAAAILLSAISESADAGDTWTAAIGVLAAGVAESASAGDLLASSLAGVASLTESANANDLWSDVLSGVATFAESANTGDTWSVTSSADIIPTLVQMSGWAISYPKLANTSVSYPRLTNTSVRYGE